MEIFFKALSMIMHKMDLNRIVNFECVILLVCYVNNVFTMKYDSINFSIFSLLLLSLIIILNIGKVKKNNRYLVILFEGRENNDKIINRFLLLDKLS